MMSIATTPIPCLLVFVIMGISGRGANVLDVIVLVLLAEDLGPISA